MQCLCSWMFSECRLGALIFFGNEWTDAEDARVVGGSRRWVWNPGCWYSSLPEASSGLSLYGEVSRGGIGTGQNGAYLLAAGTTVSATQSGVRQLSLMVSLGKKGCSWKVKRGHGKCWISCFWTPATSWFGGRGVWAMRNGREGFGWRKADFCKLWLFWGMKLLIPGANAASRFDSGRVKDAPASEFLTQLPLGRCWSIVDMHVDKLLEDH